MPRQLTVVTGLVTIGIVSFGYERLVGEFYVGLFLGCVLATVVVYLASAEDEKVASAVVFGLMAAAALVTLVVRQFRVLGWPAAVAIDVAVVAVAGVAIWYMAFGRRRIADARLLRGAAARLGWRSRPVDAELLRRVRVLYPRARNRPRALHHAIEGTVDGVPVTLVTGRSVEQAWLFRLPFGLPPLEVIGPDGGRNNPAHPELDRALVTPAVYAAARAAQVVDCRVARDDMVVRFRAAADPDAVAGDAHRVAGVVSAMPLEAARPYAVDPATVADPAYWRQAAQLHRVRVRTAAIMAVAFGLIVLACGGWNVRIPGHEAGSYIMFGTGGGLIVFGALAWLVRGRAPATR
jgi:hypothetical protein